MVASHELPIGAIRPQGWLRDQLRLQAEGITGRLEDIWPDVGPDSGWLGGDGEDWERAPYYLDGLVPLAHLLETGDTGGDLKRRVEPWIEWMLASQDDTGFFGPKTNRDWWPRMVAVKVLIQYADATGDARVEPFLERYFAFQLERLPGEPLTGWGRARGADNALGVWWLYERTREPWLLDLFDLLIEQTADWEDYLANRLITGPATLFSHFIHCVNVAMGLKAGAVKSLRDQDTERHRSLTEKAFANLDRWHGQAHGWYSGDEWLAGREATAGIETCQVVELMYTCERLAAIYGDSTYGDRLESLAFNLLPASSDARMQAHQYHQQANQVRVSVDQRPWTHSSDDANLFGLEPHFGCCTANLHQGWPKFARSLWVRDDDDGLRAVAYAPCTVEDGPLRLEVETDYPFEETIRIRFGTETPVRRAIRLRIPAWATEATLDGQPVEPGNDGHLTLEREWHNGDELTLVLPMRPRALHRERQAVAVRLGPLVLALRIPENWIPVPDAPGLGEWEVHPRTSWNHGLCSLDGIASWKVTRRRPGEVPFLLDTAPIEVEARGGYALNWSVDGAQAGPVPNGPVRDHGPIGPVTLVPYGCARLRITEFPTLAAGWTDPFESEQP